SILVNQLSGGSFVVPRRKATMSSRWLDWLGGRSALTHILSPGCRLGTSAMGRVVLPRVTRTSILGPTRSKRALSARRAAVMEAAKRQAATFENFIRYWMRLACRR